MSYEEIMNQLADELQEFILAADNDTIEDFCGFALDEISKEDAVYQVMTQMPDNVMLEYHEKYGLKKIEFYVENDPDGEYGCPFEIEQPFSFAVSAKWLKSVVSEKCFEFLWLDGLYNSRQAYELYELAVSSNVDVGVYPYK